MENTIIIKDDGLAINSSEYPNYSLVITDFGGARTSTSPDGQECMEDDAPPTIELRALKGPGEHVDAVTISTFYSLESAYQALQELVEHRTSGIEIFDVRDYNPDL